MATMVNHALVQLGVAPKPPPPKVRPPLEITSNGPPVGRRGKAYGGALRATGGVAPYRWSRVGGTLAPGLRLAANGRGAGGPTRPGSFTMRTKVIDRTGVARTRVFRLRIL